MRGSLSSRKYQATDQALKVQQQRENILQQLQIENQNKVQLERQLKLEQSQQESSKQQSLSQQTPQAVMPVDNNRFIIQNEILNSQDRIKKLEGILNQISGNGSSSNQQSGAENPESTRMESEFNPFKKIGSSPDLTQFKEIQI